MGTLETNIKQIHLGKKTSRSMTITAEHVELYAQVTGDRNPLHFNQKFASKTKFKKLVVQGGITTGLLHAMVAMDMPGPGTVFLNQNWQFNAPVFIGDTITAEAEVVKLHKSKPVTHLNVTVKRQTSEIVLEGTAVCFTMVPED